MKRLAFVLAAALGCATSPQSGRVPVRGVSLYYERHGAGQGVPLVLLPGGGSTIEVTYGQALPLFAKRRRVIAVEEQGHGRSTGREGPSTFEASADDVAALLDRLGVVQADVFGFSNGASVALQVAVRHPGKVRRLVFASSITKREGAHAWFWDFMAKADFSTMPPALKEHFLKVNPDPAALRRMHDQDAARMRAFKDVSDDVVKSVQIPVLVMHGDRDLVRPEHGAELARLFPKGRLCILPGGHGDWLGEAIMTQPGASDPALAVGLVDAFLDGP